jgi:hypothetical protein
LSSLTGQRNHGTQGCVALALAWFFCPLIHDKGTTELGVERELLEGGVGCPLNDRRLIFALWLFES